MKYVLIGITVMSWAIGAVPAARADEQASCAPAEGLHFICGVQSPEDLVRVPDTHWLIASGMAAGSGLYLVDTRAKSARKIYSPEIAGNSPDRKRFAHCPAPLDPKLAVLHGLSLRPARKGHYTVYATNHGGRESVEVFDIDVSGAAPAARWVGCVLTNGMSTNSVAAFGDGTLLATVPLPPGKTGADLVAGRAASALLRWTPGTPAFTVVPGTERYVNNGIDTSPDGREFYLAVSFLQEPGRIESMQKRIVVYSRDNPARAVRFADLDFGPDNVRWTDGKQLITAGARTDEPHCANLKTLEEHIKCQRGYIVASIDPQTMAVTELARGPALPFFKGVSMAMKVGDDLWIGSYISDRLAYRSLEP